MDWDKYGYVVASEYRKKVMISLYNKPKIPVEISEDTDYHLSHISNTLKELSEKGIVKCITDNRSKGRVYKLTGVGEEIVEEIER